MNSARIHISIWFIVMALVGLVACTGQEATPVDSELASVETTPTSDEIPTAETAEPTATPFVGLPLFFIAPDGHMYRTSVVDGHVREQVSILPEPLQQGQEGEVTVGPRGEIIYGQSEVNVWQELFLYRPPQISPDGEWIILNDGVGRWSLINLRESLVAAKGSGHWLLSTTWAPDSQQFAYLDRDKQLCIYYIDLEIKTCIFQHDENLLGGVWSPDGNYIAGVVVDECCEAEVWLIDPLSEEAYYVGDASITFESSLDRIITWAQAEAVDEAKLLINAQANFTQAALYIPYHDTWRHFDRPMLDISPDGNYLLSSEGEIVSLDGDVLYTPSDRNETGRFYLHHWDWSPTGDKVAYLTPAAVDQSSRLSIISLPQANLVWQKELPHPMQIVYWSPDGRYLLLDQADAAPTDSPIWYLPSDGSEELGVVVDEGFLLRVAVQWDKPSAE